MHIAFAQTPVKPWLTRGRSVINKYSEDASDWLSDRKETQVFQTAAYLRISCIVVNTYHFRN